MTLVNSTVNNQATAFDKTVVNVKKIIPHKTDPPWFNKRTESSM